MARSIQVFLFALYLTFSPCARTGIALAQSQFQRTIGGTNADLARSIMQTASGGSLLAGNTSSFGAGLVDVYAAKFDAAGVLQWSKTLGGTSIDEAYAVARMADGGYAVANTTLSFGAGRNDMYIVKLDSDGVIKWNTTVGGAMAERALSITQSRDGGCVVAGITDSFGAGSGEMYVVKLDSSGVLQWSRTVGGTGADVALSVIQTTDGGYLLAGYTFSFGAGQNDIYIVKLDSGGTFVWSRTIGGTDYDYGYSVIQTRDGGYALAGYTQSFGAGNYDVCIVKLDTSGAPVWSRTVGGTGNDYGYSIIQTLDGGYAVAGSTQSFGAGSDDMYIAKLDTGGTLQWSRTVGGQDEDIARSIMQTSDGGYAVAGATRSFGAGSSDVYIVKLDSSGNTCANSTSPTSTVTTPSPTVSTPTPTVTTPGSIVTIPSPTVGSGGIVISICTSVGVRSDGNEIPRTFELHQNTPNPFNPITRIRFSIALPRGRIGESERVSLKVFDVLGREVATLVNEHLLPGSYEVTFDAAGLASGVYFYRLTGGSYTALRRMVILK